VEILDLKELRLIDVQVSVAGLPKPADLPMPSPTAEAAEQVVDVSHG
jgi:hypothetical protein